jgi:hypothetical protein
MSGNTTPAGSATPSLADMPTSMMISYASVANPGITWSVVLLLSSCIAPPGNTISAGRTNNLIRQILSPNRTQAIPHGTPVMASTEELIQVDGTFHQYIDATNVQFMISPIIALLLS